jgi:phosphotransferase system HPr-like phosphotransfer protein
MEKMEKNPGEFLYEKKCMVGEPFGLCARPSIAIVAEAARICGPDGLLKLFIRRADNNSEAPLYSVIPIMMLEADFGSEVAVFTHDPEYVAAVDRLADYVASVRLSSFNNVDFELYSRTVDEAFRRDRLRRESA